jgi:GTPase
MFVDIVQLQLIAGKGGNGVVAWRREKYIPKGGPAGGDGGNGGSILIKSDSHIYSLEDYRNIKTIKADNGEQGGSAQKKGRNGKDKIVKVPVGTIVKNLTNNEIIFDFTELNQELKICQGGKGGKGNFQFKSSTNRAPNISTDGTLGKEVKIELELKLLADVGLVGLPNAGKSTIISKLAKIPVKIAPYPFTTLRPNLGIVEFDDYSRVLIADIPGIIENAHKNKGLGLAFLKHIERTEALAFVIDVSAFEGNDPYQDFITLQNELKTYDPKMLDRPFITILNKIDLIESFEILRSFKENYQYDHNTLIEISAKDGVNLDMLKDRIKKIAQIKTKKF